ncbi:hypothetical protein ANRL1_04101 [Anaerolineae bacterium]|nr:hypothetical protein ANRL1_04101 [Anaerolineae bacterium]
MATDGQELNVTRGDNKSIHVKRSFVKGVTADLVKHEIKLTLTITLDESLLAVRDDMAFWAFDETPVALVLKPARTQLGLPLYDGVESVTISGGGHSVTLGRDPSTNAQDGSGDDENS